MALRAVECVAAAVSEVEGREQGMGGEREGVMLDCLGYTLPNIP